MFQRVRPDGTAAAQPGDVELHHRGAELQRQRDVAAADRADADSMDGSPSGEGTFNLFGSGFQAGAMTVTVGGVTLPDRSSPTSIRTTRGRAATAQDRIVAPLVLDGPVTVTTAGGSATLPGRRSRPSRRCSSPASRDRGSAWRRTASGPSANVGQTITLTGQGFTNSTLVLFCGRGRRRGRAGDAHRHARATDGTTLTIVVPELARTGAVQVMGSAASYQLQIVPVLRSVGGAVPAATRSSWKAPAWRRARWCRSTAAVSARSTCRASPTTTSHWVLRIERDQRPADPDTDGAAGDRRRGHHGQHQRRRR